MHRTKRRIIGQGLNQRAMHRFEPVMIEHIDLFLKELVKASINTTSVDMTNSCNHLGFDISLQLGFGHGLDLQTDDRNRWVVDGVSTSNWRINLYMQLPFLKSLHLDKILLIFLLPRVLRYHRLVKDMINSRRQEAKDAKPDLFSFVSDYKDPESGQNLSPRELWSESTFLIPAGMCQLNTQSHQRCICRPDMI